MTNHSIQRKCALVTGGAKNLGGLIALDLTRHGADAVAYHTTAAAAAHERNRPTSLVQ